MNVSPAVRYLLRYTALAYLVLLLIVPVGLILWRTFTPGIGAFFESITTPAAVSALQLSLLVVAIVVPLNVLFGVATALALVRGRFRGRGIIQAVVDLPFALPTIVASLVMLALYGPASPVGIHLQHTKWGVGIALLFVTLPFVVRSVQPVLLELDREVEEAAASLGANNRTIFTLVILPA